MSHTYAELEVSPACYDEIAHKLKQAGYDHAFMPERGRDTPTIDMHGIGLTREASPTMEQRRLGATERYHRDPLFHAIVDNLRHLMHGHDMTPTEIREAAILAVVIEESHTVRTITIDDVDKIRRGE